MDNNHNYIIIASELNFDEEVIYSVKLLQKHYNVDDKYVFKYEELHEILNYNNNILTKKITKDKNNVSCINNIEILFVGHNIHLAKNMCGDITREDVLQNIANIQQKIGQQEINVKFYSCHLYKNLINMKFDFLKKEEKYRNIQLILNLYASQYHLANNMFYETLKEGKIASLIKKYKGEYLVEKTEYLNNNEIINYNIITKPIVPVFETQYDKDSKIVQKRFAFPEGYLNTKNNKIYATKNELEYAKANYLNRITLDRLNKDNLDIFEGCTTLSY